MKIDYTWTFGTPYGYASTLDGMTFYCLEDLKEQILEHYEAENLTLVSIDMTFDDDVSVGLDVWHKEIEIVAIMKDLRRIRLYKGTCDIFDFLHTLDEYAAEHFVNFDE